MTRALDPCVSCGAEVRRGARFCPHCGARRPTRLPLVYVVGITVLLLTLGALVLRVS